MQGISFAFTVPTVYKNETCGIGTTCSASGSSNFVEVNKLTWTAESNSRYLVVATGTYRHLTNAENAGVTIGNRTGVAPIYSADTDTIPSTSEYTTFEYFDIYQGTGGTATYNISIRTVNSAQTTTGHFMKTFAIRLDNLANTQFNYSYRDASEAAMDNNYGDDTTDSVNVSITPATAGDYLILASAIVAADSSTLDGLRINISNSTGGPVIPSPETGEGSGAGQLYSRSIIAVKHFEAEQQNIRLQYRSTSGTSADWKNKRIIVIRLSDVFSYSYKTNIDEVSSTDDGYRNNTQLNIPTGEWLVLGGQSVSTSSTSIAYDQAFVLSNGTLFSNNTRILTSTSNYISNSFSGYLNFSGSYKTLQLQTRRRGSTTVTTKEAYILGISLGETNGSLPLDPELFPSDNMTSGTCADSDITFSTSWNITADHNLSSYNMQWCDGFYDESAQNCGVGDGAPDYTITLINESFEQPDTGNWTNDTADNGNWWIKDQGGTPSGSTGPCGGGSGSGCGAHGTDTYMFVETSAGFCNTNRQSTALIMTGPLDFDGNDVNVSWWSNMFGSTIGTLTLEENSTGAWEILWSKSGDQGTAWFWSNVNLTALSGKGTIRFNYTCAGSFGGDAAIDLINVSLSSREQLIDKWNYTGWAQFHPSSNLSNFTVHVTASAGEKVGWRQTANTTINVTATSDFGWFTATDCGGGGQTSCDFTVGGDVTCDCGSNNVSTNPSYTELGNVRLNGTGTIQLRGTGNFYFDSLWKAPTCNLYFEDIKMFRRK